MFEYTGLGLLEANESEECAMWWTWYKASSLLSCIACYNTDTYWLRNWSARKVSTEKSNRRCGVWFM